MKRFFLSLSLVFYTHFIAASEIIVLTLAAGEAYQKTVSLGIKNKQQYCQAHHYDFLCGTESLDLSRPFAWSKVLLILKAMENPQNKWIFWTDADTLVMNSGISLESLLDEKYNMILTKDWNNINAGNFFIRNCEWSRKLLKDVYAHTECIHHPWWEQQALILEFAQKPELAAQVKIIPQRRMNSYAKEIIGYRETSTYQPGDFIIHFASVHDHQSLGELFKTYARKVIHHRGALTFNQFSSLYGIHLSPLHLAIQEEFLKTGQKTVR